MAVAGMSADGNVSLSVRITYGHPIRHRRSRRQIEDEIEERIEWLDRLDGDPDLEPSLGWSRTQYLGRGDDLEEERA